MTCCSGSSIFETVFDLAGKQARILEINDRMTAGDFWTDQERARVQMDELRKLKGTVVPLQKLVGMKFCANTRAIFFPKPDVSSIYKQGAF